MVFMQKGVKPNFQAIILHNQDVFLKKGEEKIRKRRESMIHWEPTEARPKGKAEGDQEPAKWHVI